MKVGSVMYGRGQKQSMISLMVISLIVTISLVPSTGVASVAGEIQVALQGTEYVDFEIRSYIASETVWFGDYPYIVAIASKDEKNILCVFLEVDNHWTFHYAGKNALYDGEDIPVISNDEYTPIISLHYTNRSPKETIEFYPKATMKEQIKFYVYEYLIFETVSGVDQTLQLRRDEGKDAWIVLHANQYSEYSGNINIDLYEFNINSFPKSIDEAEKIWKHALTETRPEFLEENAIDVIQGLSGSIVYFHSDQVYKVYSGPGERYVRAAKGKATVSTNAPIHVYWREQDWILISYSTNNGGIRYGYIPASSLHDPKGENIVEFSEMDRIIGIGKTTQNIDILDNPNDQQSVLRLLPEESPIDILAIVENWAYIDDTMTHGEEPCRGFIPLDTIHFTANM